MAVLGPYGIVLSVPDLAPGIKFYTDAGLEVAVDGNIARFTCAGQKRESITLIGGAERKSIHHLILRADKSRFDEVRRTVPANGGQLIDAPAGFPAGGVWLKDPHGLRVHLLDAPADAPLKAATEPFEINAPGRVVRQNRSAMLAKKQLHDVRPQRLGHVLLFTPDVLRSVQFFSDALGMGLTDRAQDVIAFMCARRESDHHVVAFAKSPGIVFTTAACLSRHRMKWAVAAGR
jgi:predicted enzyme related to lactoylglutathione lyase